MRYTIFCLITVLLGVLPGKASADDLDLYGGQTINVPPNVLIIFDNSSSMMCCVSAACGTTPSNCSTLTNQRLYVAKDAIKKLINRVDGVNFALMVFNANSEGGRVIQQFGASKTTLINAINAITTTRPSSSGGASASSSIISGDWTYTPLAETLAEAGLYFSGGASWFNTGTYTSPITQPCQKNYVIVMTDGAPTKDRNSRLNGTSGLVYVNGTERIGNYDRSDRNNDGNINDLDELYDYPVGLFDPDPGSDYLDDVAKYLFDNDCRQSYGSGDFVKQNIKTYTIGFTTSNNLLNDTAVHGGTISSKPADNTADLDAAFDEILSIIQESNATFTAPAIPRNPNNQADSGDKVYMALFKPQASGRWVGNLKAFGLANGALVDSSTPPVAATDNNGTILNSAKSYWSAAADGLKVDYGGVGALLASNIARNVFTYTNQDARLWQHPSNRFTDASTNPALTTTALGVATAADRDTIISETLAGTPVKRSDGTTVANWRLGDIVHSEPLVRYFKDPNNDGVIELNESKSYIFVGANDGMLHVFNAANGSEAWAFIPPGQLANLKKRTSLNAGTEHNYFVDGTPIIESVKKSDGTIMQLLVFGERRGGKRYYALDVTNPDQPAWKYQLTDTLLSTLDWDGTGGLDGAAAALGQSWARPQFKRVRSGNQIKEVFLLAGGYDVNQDATTPAASDTVGRAMYTVRAEDGVVFGLNINAGNWQDSFGAPYMTHSILDVTGFEASRQGYMDRIYAGDLGGHVFAARYNKCTNLGCDNDNWEKMVLMDLPATLTVQSNSVTLGQKFMTKPDVTLDGNKECVYLGTGDRENPASVAAVDAFYSICNKWEKDINGVLMPVPITDLVDVTDNLVQQGTVDEKALVNTALQAGSGWYIRMSNTGEKIVSSPKILNKKVYFTTFTPGTSSINNNDPCAVSFDYGVSRLYILDYKTGAAVYDLNNSNDPLTKEDRSIVIGTSIASDPVLVTSGDTTSIYYGSGGRLERRPVETNRGIMRYFWRQLK